MMLVFVAPGNTYLLIYGVIIKSPLLSFFSVSDFIARHGHHSQQMEDFLREAKEMAKVDHCHVVTLLAVCTK